MRIAKVLSRRSPFGTALGALAIWGLAVAALPARPARAQAQPTSLQQALDKPVDLSEEAPITDIFRKLSDKTGVKFVVDEQTIVCLPYGDQTRLHVGLRNVTLRKDLSRVLAPVALQWIVENDLVRIVPSEALARMCRRASFEELQALGKLYSDKIVPAEGTTTWEQFRKTTGDKDLELSFQKITGDKAAALVQADRALPCTGAEWLDRLCQQGSWTWYLWGDQVIVLDRKAQIERQLQQQVSLPYQNEKLVTVLLNLARKARVTLAMEPGVLNYVPSEVRNNFNLLMADASIAQALEVISGATGLEFIHTEEGIRVEPSEKLVKSASATADTTRKSPFFVKVNMAGPGGTTIEVYFRAEELPDEMVKEIEAQKAQLIQRWTAGRPAATTAPATATTRPAAASDANR